MDLSLKTLLHLWGFSKIKNAQPLPHPTNNGGRVFPEFFRVSTLYRVVEGELQDIGYIVL